MEIKVVGKGVAVVEMDGRNPRIAGVVVEALPITAVAQVWMEEVYFQTPIRSEDENPVSRVEAGDLCYWSPGPAICIFYGESQPVSPVNCIAKVLDGLDLFARVEMGDRIILRRNEVT